MKPANQITSGDGRYVEGKLERTSITKQDDFTQAGEFYTKLKPIEKEHLAENLASDLKVISDDIRKVVLGYFHNVSADLVKRLKVRCKSFENIKTSFLIIKMTFLWRNYKY